MRLKDKVLLIGGAGSNMSRASALLFAQEGAKVALAARTTEKMEETAERIPRERWRRVDASNRFDGCRTSGISY